VSEPGAARLGAVVLGMVLIRLQSCPWRDFGVDHFSTKIVQAGKRDSPQQIQ
jgi:hypothetical protein